MKIFSILTLLVFIVGCTDKYDQYISTPEYITVASSSDAPYFKAYDESLKLWEVPFKELYIPTTKGIAHVIVSGPKNGDPIVLLHGMNASSTMWYPNVESFSQTHRVFAIDYILEPGKSYLMHEIESIDKVTDWYEEVIDVLELDSFHIIAASRGGWSAVNYTLSNQKKVKSLVLLSPAQTFTWIKPSVGMLKNVVALLSSKDKQMEQSLESMSSNVANISDVYLKQYELGLEKDMENKFVMSMQPFSEEELNTLKMPVLVLIGDDDLINDEGTVEIANSLPKGKGEVIQNAGHFLSIDQSEVVNKKIQEFLKK